MIRYPNSEAVPRSEPCPFCSEVVPQGAPHCPGCGETIEPPERDLILVETEQGQDWSGTSGDHGVDGFVAAYVRGQELEGALLGAVDLFGDDLTAANLRMAFLAGANLSSTDLRAADLTGANLRGADLSDAHLGGADITGADLTGAELSGATYDDFTRWPAGFNPEGAGAVRAVDGD